MHRFRQKLDICFQAGIARLNNTVAKIAIPTTRYAGCEPYTTNGNANAPPRVLPKN